MVGNIKCMQKKNNRSLTLKAFSFTQFYYFTLTLLVTHTFSINPFSSGAFCSNGGGCLVLIHL